ncbi:MAG TPA: DUF642 domain-containing protein [Candidatus Dormibacteraeota bacterium]|jgi:hypothetical protein|nr:DUF642 domain-containing protein [Candidatus Dormibacteraeota bacterium]
MSRRRLGAILAATAVVVAVVVTQRAAAGASATELVHNGGFEAPAIPNHTFAVIHSPIPGWTEAAPRTCGIEIQNHVAGSPFEGQQFTELDSLCPTEIYQDLTTIPGRTYNLTYEFSARPTRGPADNVLQAWWNGRLLDTEQLDGIGRTDTNWQKFSYHVKATGTTTRIAFADAGVANSYGTYLDAVSVTLRHHDDD